MRQLGKELNAMIKTLILDIGGIIRKSPPTNIHEDLARYLNLDIQEFLSVFLPKLDEFRIGKVSEIALWQPVISKFKLEIGAAVLSKRYVNMHVDETHRFNLANTKLLDLLSNLKDKGDLTIVAFSNTNPLKAKGMISAGLLRHFDKLVFSHDIGYLKPDKKAYLEAIRIINKPVDTMFFIDDKASNIEAGKIFGIDGVVAKDHLSAINIIKERLA